MDDACLEPDTVVDLVRGRLSADTRRSAEAHVDRCEPCRVAVADLAETLRERSDSLPSRPEATAALADRYELFEQLGRGGMGVVHRAVPVAGGPPVALKWLPAAAPDDDARRRFARETALAASLVHPNVVRVLDHGVAGDGSPFIAMELLEGEDLGRRLKRGILSIEEATRIGLAAAAGLAAAHRAGLVHRDVKPANIFLCTDLSVKVLDFGLAVRVDADAERITRTAAVVGTPAYMALEQATGRHREDARTDVWGLAATLYRAVVGRPPFDAETPLAQLVRISVDEPDPLPDTVPRWLAKVLLRSMRKDKGERFANMDELAEALAAGAADASEISNTTAKSQRQPGLVPLAGEVRLVSVLVGDEVDDTGAFDTAVRGHGGVTSALVGRRAVGIFGGEGWRGDEAERAVRAGLELRARGVRGRFGAGTGRAVRLTSGQVTGAAVGAAVSVLDAEHVGADEDTLRRIRGGFDVAGPRVLAVRVGASVIGVRGLGGAEVPLVGRDRELHDLELSLEQVASEGHAAGVLVVGPPGIGKSRLLHALAARVDGRAPAVVRLEARCEATRELEGWHALASAIRLFANVPTGTAPEVVRERLADRCPSPASAEFLGEILGADFPATPELDAARADPALLHDRVIDAVADLIESLTEHGPVLFFVEDVHFADAPSRAAIELCLRRLADRPLCVIATSRPEHAALGTFRRLELGGISRAATRALVLSVLGPGEVETSDRIHERSGGNPYFTEELALAVRDGHDDLPSSVEEAVLVRLDAVTRDERDLLRRASVFGERFWAQALSDLREDGAGPLLESLRRRDLVEPERQSRLGGMSEWRFRHAVTREVAYRTLTADQREALHRSAALWLAERPDALPLELGRHLDLGGDADGAAKEWAKGAVAALAEGNFTAGLEASDRALGRMTDANAIFRLRVLRAGAFFYLGRSEDEEHELSLVALAAPDAASRVEACELAAYAAWRRGDPERSAAMVQELLCEVPRSPRLLARLASALRDLARYDDAERTAERALDAARATDDKRTECNALSTLAYCRSHVGAIDAALELVDRSIEAASQTGDPRLAFLPRCTRALFLLAAARPEDAARELALLKHECRRTVHRFTEAYMLSVLGLAEARTGEIAQALATLDRALVLSRELRAPRIELQSLEFRGAALVEHGRPSEALAALDEAAHLMPESPAFQAEVGALRSLALADLGRLPEARAAAERALEQRRIAGGLEDFEAELFVAAHLAGVAGALDEGLAVVRARLSRIADAETRDRVAKRLHGNARLLALALHATV